MLSVKQIALQASLGSAFLLQEISFSVAKGDRVALVGASGSGKTTLLRLLNRLIDPSSGAIFWRDRHLQQLDPLAVRREIVLVPQEPKLLGMTVEEAIAYPLQLQQLTRAEIANRIDTWCDRLGIEAEWRDRSEWQLSLGQRQRVTLARALAMQPQLLLLDEPTSSLDYGNATRVGQVLLEWSREGKAVILSTHQLDFARQFGSRLLYLQDGHLLGDRPVSEVDWEQVRHDLQRKREEGDREWGES